jgi:hypothetical protein
MIGNDKIVQNLFWIESNISKIKFLLDEVCSSRKTIILFLYEWTTVGVFRATLVATGNITGKNFLEKNVEIGPPPHPPNPLEFTVDSPSWAQVSEGEK